MPSPRPLFEVYVHSRQLEGIHLRGGKVARGGIRWSDRHDDFRTEILGLMKTQMLKNAIIVPVGSKGGLVLKGTVPPRPALDGYLVDRYRQFISGLLDVTDNYVDGKVAHPPDVVRHDDQDPISWWRRTKAPPTSPTPPTACPPSTASGSEMLSPQAAATATTTRRKASRRAAPGNASSISSAISVSTSRRSPSRWPASATCRATCSGTGCCAAGDAAGCRVQPPAHLSRPDPDPEAGFAERERLFQLPRSSWRDYNTSLISAGGGVFDRSAKSIPLSPQVRALLDLESEAASGEEVIRAILPARVDLLYNGGIGTYVKASTEEDADVGDRANDRVRVNANELRARVVGEGGNLGLTQRARIEFWNGGGMMNTDAVDNSGGVDMSDHEVNIKILLDLLVRPGAGEPHGRATSCSPMTDEVSELVLADNQPGAGPHARRGQERAQLQASSRSWRSWSSPG